MYWFRLFACCFDGVNLCAFWGGCEVLGCLLNKGLLFCIVWLLVLFDLGLLFLLVGFGLSVFVY